MKGIRTYMLLCACALMLGAAAHAENQTVRESVLYGPDTKTEVTCRYDYDSWKLPSQTSAAAPAVAFSRELRLQVVNGERMNGKDVKQLQSRLIALGYLPKGEDDGWFGPKTEAALKQYQKECGLPADGVMTQTVYDMLFLR